MNAPMIGMPFLSFLVLLVLSAIVAALFHWGFRYRLTSAIDGFIGQWVVAWVGAWLGPAVLGHWFDSAVLGNIYLIPAFIGSIAAAFSGTLNAKLVTGIVQNKGRSSE